MDFIEYLEFITKKLKDTSDKDEYFRLVVLLRDTCNDTIKKLQK